MERERERERGLLTVGNEKRFAENRRGMKILWDDECWFSVAKTFSPMAGVFSKGTKENIELRGEKKQIIKMYYLIYHFHVFFYFILTAI